MHWVALWRYCITIAAHDYRPDSIAETPHRLGRRDLAIGLRAHPRHRDRPPDLQREGGRRGHRRARAHRTKEGNP